MRPYIDTIYKNEGIEGVITFLESVGTEGISLSQEEVKLLAQLLSEKAIDFKE